MDFLGARKFCYDASHLQISVEMPEANFHLKLFPRPFLDEFLSRDGGGVALASGGERSCLIYFSFLSLRFTNSSPCLQP